MYLSCCLPLVCLRLEQMRFILWYWGSIASSTNPTLSFGELLGHVLWACAMSPDFSGKIPLSLLYFQIQKIKGLCSFSFLWVYSEKFWKPNIITKFNIEKNKLFIKNVLVFLKVHSVGSPLATEPKLQCGELSIPHLKRLWITCLLPISSLFLKKKKCCWHFLANICNSCDIFINNMLVLLFPNFQF